MRNNFSVLFNKQIRVDFFFKKIELSEPRVGAFVYRNEGHVAIVILKAFSSDNVIAIGCIIAISRKVVAKKCARDNPER